MARNNKALHLALKQRKMSGRKYTVAGKDTRAPEHFAILIPELQMQHWRAMACYRCGKRHARGLRVGLLPISGKVYFCADCAKKYHEDKAFERAHKEE